MSVFLRLSLLYLFVISFSIILVLNIFYDDIKPSVRQASEETMVDSANLMAEFITPYAIGDDPDLANIGKIAELFQQRKLDAKIWSYVKQQTNFKFYITDDNGKVVFHSSDKEQQGKDYSKWRDVSRTLAGQYGARTTRVDPDNELTGEMYVSAPIMLEQKIIGVFTLIQPHQGIQQFVGPAQTKILVVGSLLLVTLIVLGLILATWFNSMLGQLTGYVNQVRHGKVAEQLNFKDPSFNELADTLHKMRQELDGKAYIEQYIHTLTHELKTPLSAISAAAQILETDVSGPKKQQFLHNIENEVKRLQQLVERLLLLASIENQQHQTFKSIDLEQIIDSEIESLAPLLNNKYIQVKIEKTQGFNGQINGDEFLLRMAIRNLLDNAIDFSHEHVDLNIQLKATEKGLGICIVNQGGKIPDYAIQRLFERFFSTPRPSTGRKSSGLGLCLVKEIAQLHGGSIKLSNLQDDAGFEGVEAELIVGKE